jgi:hypothetical protein
MLAPRPQGARPDSFMPPAEEGFLAPDRRAKLASWFLQVYENN